MGLFHKEPRYTIVGKLPSALDSVLARLLDQERITKSTLGWDWKMQMTTLGAQIERKGSLTESEIDALCDCLRTEQGNSQQFAYFIPDLIRNLEMIVELGSD